MFREQLPQRRLAQRQLTDAVSNDFGLKEEIAIAEPGSESLEVTLRNFQRRGGAAWAVATEPVGHILASTIEGLPAGAALPFRDVFEEGGGSETLRCVDAQLHQVIATPVHAPRPLVVGGLVFGFPLDDAKMANLEEQTNTVTSLVDGNALESTGLGWTPSAGLSTSAGNAWIGEELRTLCIEATWSRPGRFLGSAHDWQVSAALAGAA